MHNPDEISAKKIEGLNGLVSCNSKIKRSINRNLFCCISAFSY